MRSSLETCHQRRLVDPSFKAMHLAFLTIPLLVNSDTICLKENIYFYFLMTSMTASPGLGCMYTSVQVPSEAKGVRPSGAGLTGTCELPDMGGGTEL